MLPWMLPLLRSDVLSFSTWSNVEKCPNPRFASESEVGFFMTISIAESMSIAGVAISKPRFERQNVPRSRIRHHDHR